ncbi:MAG: phosphoribosylamine--glycine ligase [Candidatus Zipacnadales bacterium]
MRILVVGSGGREHALVWKLAQSSRTHELFCAPGNAGIAQQARLVNIDTEDLDGLADFASNNKIDLTVIGPEKPLIRGIVDRFHARGLTIFGPTQAAAQLEGSKAFTNELLHRYVISKKRFQVFTDPTAAAAYVRDQGVPIVIKADGAALGKGVYVAQTIEEALRGIEECMVQKVHGKAGERIVIEEYLAGPEVSVKVITDGKEILPLPPSQDHKRIGEGDTGPNTGGMGCYSPVPMVDQALFTTIIDKLVKPTIQAMASEGMPYTGCLYAGVILTEAGPELLEYNCRFGDPETQVVLPRLEGDFAEALLAAAQGRLQDVALKWNDEACVCVVIASKGYPGSYAKGKPIRGVEAASEIEGVTVFHAGTAMCDGVLCTNGGRVLGVTGRGPDLRSAVNRTYEAVSRIKFEGAYYRRDIAHRALA